MFNILRITEEIDYCGKWKMENLHYLCSEKGKNKKENTSYEAEFERTEKISPPAFKIFKFSIK